MSRRLQFDDLYENATPGDPQLSPDGSVAAYTRAAAQRDKDESVSALRLDASAVANVCVDTSGLTVAEVALRVQERTGGWPAPSDPGSCSATWSHLCRHVSSRTFSLT